MRTTQLKVTRIGNSKGIRLPASLLRKYGIVDTLLLEERPDELVLRTRRGAKLSWKETFEEMAREKEDWSDLESATADGLDEN